MKTIIVSFGTNAALKISYPDQDDAKIESIIALISKNTLAVHLFVSLLAKMHALTVIFTDKSMTSKGTWFPETRKIRIRNGLSVEESLQTLIFECCNAYNPRFADLKSNAFQTADDYAKYIEEGEHWSYTMAYKIYLHGILHAAWPKPADVSKFEAALSKKTWMEKAKTKCSFYNGASSHFEIYTTYFNNKHPTAPKANDHLMARDPSNDHDQSDGLANIKIAGQK
ncbi:hypothetical protein AQUSIP_08000 [Aquicella siphonis]|uniref:Uncharacterized protein n=1 Tax=Aquicella siphonis TaxID=254247 RepID=A0A5E4PEV2_9COXI|nr:hypothetical protein [Aquicella siphonis]VVC75510.1 hypothetical protein AQUSIP_08000 [Aquicella siphonis]